MRKLNGNRVGLALGSLLALAHLGWIILVALNWAKPLTDFVLDIHRINLGYNIGNFDAAKAVLLIIFTFIVGYAIGWVFSTIWNALRK